MKKHFHTLLIGLLFTSSLSFAAGRIEVSVPLDINTATASELSSIKGIGENRAEAIVNYRSQHGAFQSVSDLSLIKGISQNSINRIEKNNPDRLVAKKKK
jgi:competence protein ComEA